MSQPSYNHDRLFFVVDNLKKKKMMKKWVVIYNVYDSFFLKLGKVWINLFYT
jgi:hypothetical protein